jgi:hypothetical protein
MVFREIIVVYSKNHTELLNTFCGKNIERSVLNNIVHIVTTVN